MAQHSDKFLTRFDNLPEIKQDNLMGRFTISKADYAKDKVAIQFKSVGLFKSEAVEILNKAGVKNYNRWKQYVNYSGREGSFVVSIAKTEKFLMVYETYLTDLEQRREEYQ